MKKLFTQKQTLNDGNSMMQFMRSVHGFSFTFVPTREKCAHLGFICMPIQGNVHPPLTFARLCRNGNPLDKRLC